MATIVEMAAIDSYSSITHVSMSAGSTAFGREFAIARETGRALPVAG